MRKWESLGAAVYTLLGTAYYFHKWLIVLGLGGDALAIVFWRGTIVPPIVAVASTIVMAWGIAAWLVKTKKRLHFLNPDLEIVQMTDTYCVPRDETPGRYTFEKRLTVKARRSGVDTYRLKMKWSGTGEYSYTVDRHDCTITRGLSRDGVWDIISIGFPRPLRHGKKESFVVRFTLMDEAQTAQRFFQKYIDDFYPRGLVMHVVLAKTPTRVVRELFLSPRTDLAMWSEEPEILTDSTEISWRIRKPAIGRRYRLSWDV